MYKRSLKSCKEIMMAMCIQFMVIHWQQDKTTKATHSFMGKFQEHILLHQQITFNSSRLALKIKQGESFALILESLETFLYIICARQGKHKALGLLSLFSCYSTAVLRRRKKIVFPNITERNCLKGLHSFRVDPGQALSNSVMLLF